MEIALAYGTSGGLHAGRAFRRSIGLYVGVLQCWAVTFVVLAAALVIDQQFRGHIAPMDGRLALVVATGTAVVLAPPALAPPLSY